MRRTTATLLLVAWALPVLSPARLGAEEKKFSAEDLEFFEIEVLPVLKKNCFRCHGAREKLKGHFRITSRAGLIQGGDIGPAVNLSDPGKSRILAMIGYKDPDHSMPPKSKLEDREIAIITRWVELGAPFGPKHEIHGKKKAEDDEFDPTRVSEHTKNYWAFRPVVEPQVPSVDDPAWSANPLDRFVYARLTEKDLKPNGPANRRELLRRAYYDLTGLPPTLEEVEAFEKDTSADAFEKVVERLLDSPQYGEKWGRHWLDLVRFAESNGYERDSLKPMAWAYRDYVIRSFNEDKTYDRFLREQLAGDELDEVTPDSIAATGFYRLGLWDDEPVDREKARYDYLDSILATTSEVMLGLTVGCARCHDHKIDPIPSRDYYRLLAFFQNISPHGKGKANLVSVAGPEAKKRFDERVQAKEAAETALHTEVYDIEQRFLATASEKFPQLVSLPTASSDLVELGYRFYRDSWKKLPPFDELKHETAGRISHNFISLRPASRPDAMGLVFEGRLRVPRDGEYRFHLDAKDGSRLIVAGEVVTTRDGRGRKRHEGRIELAKGYVPFRLEYFNHSGKPLLDVQWSGPDFQRRRLCLGDDGDSTTLLADARKGAQAWSYTFEEPKAADWMSLEYELQHERNGWKRGPSGFGRRGTPGTVVRTEWHGQDIWLRREFEVRAAPRTLTLWIHHDENAEVYLNGKLIKTLSGYKVRYEAIELGREAAEILREGTNVVAIHCRNTGAGQYIDAGLGDRAGIGNLADLIAAHGAEVLGADIRKRYIAARDELEKSRKTKLTFESHSVMAVGERGRRKTHILRRGNPKLAAEEVTPGFLEVLSPPEPEIVDRGKTSGQRRVLADWIVHPDNPVTARVAVNRIWQFHFGRGIVRSSNNFGRIGDRPTHPALLDWLAATFVKKGWSMKALHRLIMLSRTYQMSSRGQDEGLAADPTNDLLWRFDMRRLTAEEVRDSILVSTGTLNLKMGGPSFYPHLSPEVLATSSTGAGKWGKSSNEDRNRRSVYIMIRRSLQDPMLTTFDFADTDSSCAVRFSTTVPTQALLLLNSHFVNVQAEKFAARLRKEAGAEVEKQVSRAFEIALSRRATAKEIARGLVFLKELQEGAGLSAEAALDRFGLLILNLNEFMFID